MIMIKKVKGIDKELQPFVLNLLEKNSSEEPEKLFLNGLEVASPIKFLKTVLNKTKTETTLRVN